MKTITKSICLTVTALTLAWFALSPTALAVTPAPDGGYPNYNTAEGSTALFSLTTGTGNTAVGQSALYYNTSGNYNTATGYTALLRNTTGSNNTATGGSALYYNTTGHENTAIGVSALQRNTTGFWDTAIGYQALYANTTGQYNTATGYAALLRNTTGYSNTANGALALQVNTTGSQNTATGGGALQSNTTGSRNTSFGLDALSSNTNGGGNTAVGYFALHQNTTGISNVAVGGSALQNTTGSGNVALGTSAGYNLTTGNNNVDISNKGVAGESGVLRIGTPGFQTRTFISGISGVAVAGATVVVNGSGQLGVAASSRRFKKQIKPMDKASEAILALKPVTFHYKKEIDCDGTPQFGLVAEEVEKVDPALVARDADGKVYTVRYDAVNAMLLNEFLKAHRRIEKQDKRIDELTAQLKQQAALIHQVSDKVELARPAPQLVENR